MMCQNVLPCIGDITAGAGGPHGGVGKGPRRGRLVQGCRCVRACMGHRHRRHSFSCSGTASYHTIPYHTIPYLAMSRHTIPCFIHTVWHRRHRFSVSGSASYDTAPCLSCHIVLGHPVCYRCHRLSRSGNASYHTVLCDTIPYRVVPYSVLTRRVLSYRVEAASSLVPPR